MNTVHARSRETHGGYIGEYRIARWGGYESVRTASGKPRIFPSDKDAKIAAHEALIAAMYRPIRSTGEKASVVKAEKELAKIFPGKGRRPVTVERR